MVGFLALSALWIHLREVFRSVPASFLKALFRISAFEFCPLQQVRCSVFVWFSSCLHMLFLWLNLQSTPSLLDDLSLSCWGKFWKLENEYALVHSWTFIKVRRKENNSFFSSSNTAGTLPFLVMLHCSQCLYLLWILLDWPQILIVF